VDVLATVAHRLPGRHGGFGIFFHQAVPGALAGGLKKAMGRTMGCTYQN
jgi:hypothetical protein